MTTLELIKTAPNKAYNKLVKTEAQDTLVDSEINERLLAEGKKTFTVADYNAILSDVLKYLFLAGKLS